MVAIGLVTQRHSTTELFNSGNSRTVRIITGPCGSSKGEGEGIVPAA
jgi:hypothetical protein